MPCIYNRKGLLLATVTDYLPHCWLLLDVMLAAAAVFGAGAVVLDRARFTLSGNSSVSNNTAYHSGGAIHGSGASRVFIQMGALTVLSALRVCKHSPANVGTACQSLPRS
jgi:predicted outer membrane repeat protein